MKQNKVLSKKDYFSKGEHLKIEKRKADSFPLHSHEYFELEIIVKGKGINILNSKEYHIQRGSVYLLKPSDFHEVEIIKDVYLWNIVFDESIIKANLLSRIFAVKNLAKDVDEKTLSKIEKTLELIKDEIESSGEIEHLIEYLFKMILPKDKVVVENSPIYSAICYMESHFKSSPSLEQTAKHACLSPVYFTTLLKKQTGETYVGFLNNLKINHAKKLLDNGAQVTQACFDSGFGSLSGFLYTFKKVVGTSPLEYSKKSKK